MRKYSTWLSTGLGLVFAFTGCSSDNASLNSLGQSALAKPPPVQCPPGYTAQGNHCKPIPQPPVQCPDGSTVPAGQTCPVPPPTTITCPDGSVIPATGNCPEPVPPVNCPDGSTVPTGQSCPETPPPVVVGGQPTYGDIVRAIQACTGSYMPDQLVIGTRYKVVGLATTSPMIGSDPTPRGVILNPEVDDGLHRGDGYWALWVPFECVERIAP
jgi:hypothetical protein